MKKRTLLLLGTAAVLALSIAGTFGAVAVASADTTINQDSSDSATTKVTYQVKDSWTLTVPESIVVGGAGGDVSASNVKIAPDKELTITAKSANEWNVKSGENQIEYELKVDGETSTGDILTVEAGTDSGSAALTATVKEDGSNENYSTGDTEYSDTLTFEVSVA